MNTNYRNNYTPTFKQRFRNKSVASEEINECVGNYTFTALVEEDKEVLSLLKNPFIIALKCTIKQGSVVLGIGRANSILSPKNRFLKNAVLYCWNAAIVDGISKTVRILNDLPLKGAKQKETKLSVGVKENTKEPDLEGRDKKAFFSGKDMPQVATEKQKSFLSKLVSEQCDDDSKEEYLKQLESPYLSKFECSELINSLLPVK